jgi:hypothetical protein
MIEVQQEAPPPNQQLAASLVQRLELTDIVITAFEARHIRGVPARRLGYSHGFGDVQWGIWEGEVRAAFPFMVQLEAHGDANEVTPLARMSLTVRADYRIDERFSEKDEEAVNHYLGLSGIMHVWPYIRAEVQSMSIKLGFPALTLPVLLPGLRGYAKISKLESTSIEAHQSRGKTRGKVRQQKKKSEGGQTKALSRF